jgi:hypothetical protein
MKDGCVNPTQKDAFEILKIMIHSLLENVQYDGEVVVYSVPANAINAETDADYHRKLLEAIFRAYKSEEGFKVDPRPINEGMALVYAELKNKVYTGIGVSCGAGMVNVAFSLLGAEVFSFAIVNSGDWIENLSWLEYNHGEWSLKFFNEKDFEKPIIEKNDISVNMEELIHPKVFAEFATQKV